MTENKSLWGKGKRIIYVNGKELIDGLIQTKIINGSIVSVSDRGDLICNSCLRELKGFYYSVCNDENLNLFLCVACFKLVQSLWRLDQLGLFNVDKLNLKNNDNFI